MENLLCQLNLGNFVDILIGDNIAVYHSLFLLVPASFAMAYLITARLTTTALYFMPSQFDRLKYNAEISVYQNSNRPDEDLLFVGFASCTPLNA